MGSVEPDEQYERFLMIDRSSVAGPLASSILQPKAPSLPSSNEEPGGNMMPLHHHLMMAPTPPSEAAEAADERAKTNNDSTVRTMLACTGREHYPIGIGTELGRQREEENNTLASPARE